MPYPIISLRPKDQTFALDAQQQPQLFTPLEDLYTLAVIKACCILRGNNWDLLQNTSKLHVK